MSLEGRWYRFFLDEGVLFLDSVSSPDLDDGESYVDLAQTHECVGARLIDFTMHDGVLDLAFDDGLTLQVRTEDGVDRLDAQRTTIPKWRPDGPLRHQRVDVLLTDDTPDGSLSVSLNLPVGYAQWSGASPGRLVAIHRLLTEPHAEWVELYVGEAFGAPVYLVAFESAYSIKIRDGGDLFELSIPEDLIDGLRDSFVDEIDAWT